MNIDKHIEEAYQHIKPYWKSQKELAEMCKHCGRYCGNEHDYD